MNKNIFLNNFFFLNKTNILVKNLPDFVLDSDFLNSLINEDDEENNSITIPLLKFDENIENIQDFKDFYKKIDFFGVKKYPKTFIIFF